MCNTKSKIKFFSYFNRLSESSIFDIGMQTQFGYYIYFTLKKFSNSV